jgi:hypothetical protein
LRYRGEGVRGHGEGAVEREGMEVEGRNDLNIVCTYAQFKIGGKIKLLHSKQKLKQYVNTKSALQNIVKGILHIEDENRHNHERIGV